MSIFISYREDIGYCIVKVLLADIVSKIEFMEFEKNVGKETATIIEWVNELRRPIEEELQRSRGDSPFDFLTFWDEIES